MTTEGRVIQNFSNQQPKCIINTVTQAQRHENIKPQETTKLPSNEFVNKRNLHQTHLGEKFSKSFRNNGSSESSTAASFHSAKAREHTILTYHGNGSEGRRDT